MIGMESRTACFTGHRELPTDDLPEISKRLEDTLVKLIEQGYRYFGAGIQDTIKTIEDAGFTYEIESA